MRGAVSQLPHMFSWRNAYLSKGYSFMSWCLVKQEILLHGVVRSYARDTPSWRGA